jgi:hypothetical protein
MFNSCLTFSQVNLTGKVFSALYSTSCKEFSNGSCIIQTYCSLKFDKKTVTVSYSSEAECTAKEKEKLYEKSTEKIYSWSIKNKVIIFNDFNDFGNLHLSEDGNLVGKKFPSDKVNNIKFTKEPQH